jgi:hypothetical protein
VVAARVRGAACCGAACMHECSVRATVVRAVCVGAAACDRDAARVHGAAACVGAFERTKCGRTHFGRIFTFKSTFLPLLAIV